jgi:predicted  nucleic acid-binding Zn-ribbon protein
MDANIEPLVRLQATDLEMAESAAAVAALPARVAALEKKLAAAEQRASGLEATLRQEERLRRQCEGSIRDQQVRRDRLRGQVASVRTAAELEALEHEIAFAEAEIVRLEDEEFSSLERTETAEAEQAAARAEVEAEREELEGMRLWAAREKQRQQERLAELEGRRQALRPAIDEGLLMTYDRVSRARRTGLARAENHQCQGCQMGLRPQLWNQLREGALLSCESCGRLLWWDPSLAAAAEAKKPGSAPMPPAGRAAGGE